MAQDRKEYFKQYRAKHRAKLVKASKDWYEKNKRKALTYAKEQYIINREAILAKLKNRDLSYLGHIHAIYKAIKKYAKDWQLPISDWNEFKLWTIDDVGYNEKYDEWKMNLFDGQFSPVVMRLVKKNGFVVGNLEWKIKGDYSFWNEDSKLKDLVEKELDDQQKERNKRDKEWRKKVREEWKAKRKKK